MAAQILKNLSDLDRFSDIPVSVEVRIGARKATVREVVGLKAGSVVVVDRPAGETLDLFIGNVRLASVEVVAVDDRLAVRITEFEGYRAPEAQGNS